MNWTTFGPILAALAILLVPQVAKLLRGRSVTAAAAGNATEARVEGMSADAMDLVFEVLTDHEHGKAVADSIVSASRTPEMRDFLVRGLGEAAAVAPPSEKSS